MKEDKDTRYPYTYAADYIRTIAGYTDNGTKLSRADAAKIHAELASILGINGEEFARKIADKYLEKQEEIIESNAKQIMTWVAEKMGGIK